MSLEDKGWEGGLDWRISRAYMQHFSGRVYTNTLKSMVNGMGGLYDVYERMTYVHTFEKPKVWIF
jgi:hypothetical protein